MKVLLFSWCSLLCNSNILSAVYSGFLTIYLLYCLLWLASHQSKSNLKCSPKTDFLWFGSSNFLRWDKGLFLEALSLTWCPFFLCDVHLIKVEANSFFSIYFARTHKVRKGMSWAIGNVKGINISSGHGHSCSDSVSIWWAVCSSPSWILNRIFTQWGSLVDFYLQDCHSYSLQASSFKSIPILFISLQILSILLSINIFYCHKLNPHLEFD